MHPLQLLFRPAFHGVLVWQLLAIPALALLSWPIGMSLGALTRLVLTRIASRTSVAWDDVLVVRLALPITAAWALLLFGLGVPFLGVPDATHESIRHALGTALFAVLLFALVRLVDVVSTTLSRSEWALSHPASRSLVPLGTRVVKVFVVVASVLALLAQLGYSVTSLVAGLGIGGLALALAAQKTVENLFGAFSIGVDQPFREGDFVKVDDLVGTVEAIGLRSTRIRTLDRTLVTIPNGKLADARVESFSARDRIRFATTVSLVYETTSSQMRAVLEGLEKTLRAHPKMWPDAVVVRFKELGSTSLDIEVMAWFTTTDWSEFQVIRQDILLDFMHVVERAGSAFAFPTQTLHLAAP